MVCVRRQQSQLSLLVWVSFQHLPTLSHNTLEKANTLFVPLLTGEGTGTLKSQFCSGRQPWGEHSVGQRGILGGMPWVPLSPCSPYPPYPLTNLFPPNPRATKPWERCFGGEAEDLSAVNIFGELFFVPLQPAHGPAIAAAPRQF